MLAQYTSRPSKTFLGPLDIRTPEDIFATDEEVAKRSAESPRSRAIDQAMIQWETSRNARDPYGLSRAARSLLEATADYYRARGVPLIAHNALPRQFVEQEVEAARELPPREQAAVVTHIIDFFDASARTLVAQQFAEHLGSGVVDAAPGIKSRLPRLNGRQSVDEMYRQGNENWKEVDLRRAGIAAERNVSAQTGRVAPLSGGPSGQAANSQEDCSAGCACDNSCPTNEKLTCRPHQKMYGDFSGEGYGQATRRGWLWNEHPIVKYGCYKCTSESGKRCGFSGPGKPGTQDLYGVDSESRWSPASNEFRVVPIGVRSFTIDPRRPNEYPPEMYEAIKRGIKSCKRAGTCPVDNPPFDPE